VTVFSLLVTCLFIFLDISHIVYFFPFNWGKLVSGVGAFLLKHCHVLLLFCDSAVTNRFHSFAFGFCINEKSANYQILGPKSYKHYPLPSTWFVTDWKLNLAVTDVGFIESTTGPLYPGVMRLLVYQLRCPPPQDTVYTNQSCCTKMKLKYVNRMEGDTIPKQTLYGKLEEC
jgi:hypothetical protein